MSYNDYLLTDYWKAVAQAVKARAGYRCQICNSGLDLQAHHRTYEHRGKELDHLDDLTCLCRRCHGVFHGKEEAPAPTPAPAIQASAFRKQSHRRPLPPPSQVVRIDLKSLPVPAPYVPSSTVSPSPVNDGLVLVTQANFRRVRNNKEMWWWMRDKGIEPDRKGWAKRMIGQRVPPHFLRGGK